MSKLLLSTRRAGEDSPSFLSTTHSSGIGRAVAILFAREGADVTIVYLPEEQPDAEDTKKLVEKEGRKCLLVPGDLMDNNKCKDAIEQHVKEYGNTIHVLVNNASKQIMCEDFAEIDLDNVESTFRSNVLQMFAMTKFALPYMKKGGSYVVSFLFSDNIITGRQLTSRSSASSTPHQPSPSGEPPPWSITPPRKEPLFPLRAH